MKKYNSYSIEIIHLNGNKQIREANNNSSYKDTISLYHKIKDDYMNKAVNIDFVGITEDEEKGVIFSKKNTLIEDEKRNIGDLMDTILEATKELQSQFDIVSNKMAYYDKKKSNIDHLMVEAVDIDELTEEDIIQIFYDTREVNLMRRDYKILNKIGFDVKGNIGNILNNSRRMVKTYDKQIDRNSKKLKSLIDRDDNYNGVHLTKEIPYKDFKDRMRIMNDIKKQYDKIVNFPEKKVLACYNKCS